MSSLSAISAQNPSGNAYLQAVVALLAKVPSTSSTPEFSVIKAVDAAVKTVLFIPLLDDAVVEADAPPGSVALLQSEALFCRVTGTSATGADGGHTLVCDIVGGQQAAQAHILQGQCGITLRDVSTVLALTPCGVSGAVRGKIIELGARADDLAGNVPAPAPASSSSAAKGVDLEGGLWECFAKAQIHERMSKIMALPRLWDRPKVLAYAPDLVPQGKWLQRSCDAFRTSTAAPPAGHIDRGLEHFMGIAHLPVLADGSGVDSRFERALCCQLESLDYELLSILDFGEGLGAGSFKAVSSRQARNSLGIALENFQQFWRTFSSPNFGTSLKIVIESFRDEFPVWSRIQDDYLLYRVSLMLHGWAGDVGRQKKSARFPERKYTDGAGCAALLGDYALEFVTNGRLAATGKRRASAIEGDKDGNRDDKGKGTEDKVKGKDDREKPPRQKGCAYCILQQLGVKNQAGEVLACRKAEFFTHIPDIKAISKAYAFTGK
ncbi:hypothetical protein B484DRAFT_406557, partial [Ochromonadaceae sp. CCMP2298]